MPSFCTLRALQGQDHQVRADITEVVTLKRTADETFVAAAPHNLYRTAKTAFASQATIILKNLRTELTFVESAIARYNLEGTADEPFRTKRPPLGIPSFADLPDERDRATSILAKPPSGKSAK